jgi:hypothetical protein
LLVQKTTSMYFTVKAANCLLVLGLGFSESGRGAILQMVCFMKDPSRL